LRRRLPHMIHRDGSSLPVSTRSVRSQITDYLTFPQGYANDAWSTYPEEARRCGYASVRHSWWLHHSSCFLCLHQAQGESRISSPEPRESFARCSGHTAVTLYLSRGVRVSGTSGLRMGSTSAYSRWDTTLAQLTDMGQERGRRREQRTAILSPLVVTGVRGPVNRDTPRLYLQW
jgi:hypothetical protein